jgi:hypothetical protein
MPQTVPSRPTKGAVDPDRGQQGQATFEAHALAGHGLAQGAIDEFRTVQRLDQAAAFVARMMLRSSLAASSAIFENGSDFG